MTPLKETFSKGNNTHFLSITNNSFSPSSKLPFPASPPINSTANLGTNPQKNKSFNNNITMTNIDSHSHSIDVNTTTFKTKRTKFTKFLLFQRPDNNSTNNKNHTTTNHSKLHLKHKMKRYFKSFTSNNNPNHTTTVESKENLISCTELNTLSNEALSCYNQFTGNLVTTYPNHQFKQITSSIGTLKRDTIPPLTDAILKTNKFQESSSLMVKTKLPNEIDPAFNLEPINSMNYEDLKLLKNKFNNISISFSSDSLTTDVENVSTAEANHKDIDEKCPFTTSILNNYDEEDLPSSYEPILSLTDDTIPPSLTTSNSTICSEYEEKSDTGDDDDDDDDRVVVSDNNNPNNNDNAKSVTNTNILPAKDKPISIKNENEMVAKTKSPTNDAIKKKELKTYPSNINNSTFVPTKTYNFDGNDLLSLVIPTFRYSDELPLNKIVDDVRKGHMTEEYLIEKANNFEAESLTFKDVGFYSNDNKYIDATNYSNNAYNCAKPKVSQENNEFSPLLERRSSDTICTPTGIITTHYKNEDDSTPHGTLVSNSSGSIRFNNFASLVVYDSTKECNSKLKKNTQSNNTGKAHVQAIGKSDVKVDDFATNNILNFNKFKNLGTLSLRKDSTSDKASIGAISNSDNFLIKANKQITHDDNNTNLDDNYVINGNPEYRAIKQNSNDNNKNNKQTNSANLLIGFPTTTSPDFDNGTVDKGFRLSSTGNFKNKFKSRLSAIRQNSLQSRRAINNNGTEQIPQDGVCLAVITTVNDNEKRNLNSDSDANNNKTVNDINNKSILKVKNNLNEKYEYVRAKGCDTVDFDSFMDFFTQHEQERMDCEFILIKMREQQLSNYYSVDFFPELLKKNDSTTKAYSFSKMMTEQNIGRKISGASNVNNLSYLQDTDNYSGIKSNANNKNANV
ncbi:protein phosphatase regulator GIP1 SCDLUD_003609 [Saccharomycodes ludwigii]|uniref:protein phosphatase regulator GIP1 n=1 Tax=Saccharomycodes ludwigii TaxID=36035 RepID=UPI001E853A9D|nr:hypothetical protein SCDLUD_003609 [Saccharomycodes ludwigii]KAH3900617.1 hypothetical protein SCDLUD_003609 [Saccharomycodes ludwigii]